MDGRLRKMVDGHNERTASDIFIRRHLDRTEDRFVIEIAGVEGMQRGILADDLESEGVSVYTATYIAATCSVDLLPDRDAVEALIAIGNIGKDDDSNGIFGNGSVAYTSFPGTPTGTRTTFSIPK